VTFDKNLDQTVVPAVGSFIVVRSLRFRLGVLDGTYPAANQIRYNKPSTGSVATGANRIEYPILQVPRLRGVNGLAIATFSQLF